MLTPDQFFTKYNGKPLEYNNDQYKDQCMDEFWAYLREVMGLSTLPYQGWGTAKNCYNNFEQIINASKYFLKIKNVWSDPNCQPKKGDIVFWGTYPFVTGLAGHVAICYSATGTSIVSFDQNFPTGSVCHFQRHSYKGVMGWLTPRK